MRHIIIYGDWGLGMGIGDWGLGPIPNPQSPIPNPQSPIPIKYFKMFFLVNEFCHRFRPSQTFNLFFLFIF